MRAHVADCSPLPMVLAQANKQARALFLSSVFYASEVHSKIS